jgi:hypothetical protein
MRVTTCTNCDGHVKIYEFPPTECETVKAGEGKKDKGKTEVNSSTCFKILNSFCLEILGVIYNVVISMLLLRIQITKSRQSTISS